MSEEVSENKTNKRNSFYRISLPNVAESPRIERGYRADSAFTDDCIAYNKQTVVLHRLM
uniref:AlNc14C65G4619 protein n=1 Tax=Albugo laibachii Nc14 TaxID=890382 RepID=F0WD99_9STRA|nr:AlNc14C65G4619 [Albugo laibachii Nc14]|eukprot:CCA19171.1 AlNc14C65G4619 [Albugo laibachii Nc14]